MSKVRVTNEGVFLDGLPVMNCVRVETVMVPRELPTVLIVLRPMPGDLELDLAEADVQIKKQTPTEL